MFLGNGREGLDSIRELGSGAQSICQEGGPAPPPERLPTFITSLPLDICSLLHETPIPAYRFSGEGQAANPSHDKDGIELAGAALKKGKAKADSARKQRAFFEKQVQEKGPTYLQDLRAEIAAAEAEVVAKSQVYESLNRPNRVNDV